MCKIVHFLPSFLFWVLFLIFIYFIFIYFTYKPQFSFLPLLPLPLPPSTHPHSNLSKGKASHRESARPDILSWGRTEALSPSSRLSKASHHMEWAPERHSCNQDRSWSHCQGSHNQTRPQNCRPLQKASFELPNWQSRVHEVPRDQVSCLCGFPPHDLDLLL